MDELKKKVIAALSKEIDAEPKSIELINTLAGLLSIIVHASA